MQQLAREFQAADEKASDGSLQDFLDIVERLEYLSGASAQQENR